MDLIILIVPKMTCTRYLRKTIYVTGKRRFSTNIIFPLIYRKLTSNVEVRIDKKFYKKKVYKQSIKKILKLQEKSPLPVNDVRMRFKHKPFAYKEKRLEMKPKKISIKKLLKKKSILQYVNNIIGFPL